ncbi:hypothetical protein CHGG_01807 [Chaetomium globosum CBS 148.51]|uniref:C3H1-type domain-containing protein n=1 Tax=Chaetomium globosum (strain ATCC 6205 / CBS 148.51 / DSM 1962 / NBRC 6347 / NRRL 1970) TaxID=306901 RepID=Q2HD97_CHAGB|nr:uncharacterized protein CHGG_01807 [Chaetomium globosum CBS 148.51]EAQ93572.1 hypothetical protein CHGG_01807 [Chaetomium globosum CBS 148.51]
MAAQPRFFIVRPDTKRVDADGKTYIIPGPIVPLVAADELPEWLDIPSAPRNLSIEQTVNLCNLGIASKSKDPYAVKIIQHATPVARQRAAAAKNLEAKSSNAVATLATQPPSITPASASNDEKATATTATPTAHRVDRTRAHEDETHTGAVSTSTTAASIHNPQAPPPQTQSEHPTMTNTNPAPGNNTIANNTNYCRHWCRYGNCKRGVRCRYLHAMPTTTAELAAIGLREIPAWWMAAAAGVGSNSTPSARLRPHQHRQPHQYHQQQQRQQQQEEHHHQQQQHPQQHHPQHAQQSRHHHHNIDSGRHSQNHNHGQPDPGAAAAGSVGSDGVLDPRDIRFALARQLTLRRAQDHAHAHTQTHAGDIAAGGGASGAGASGAGNGGSGATAAAAVGGRNRGRKVQLRETVALLRELGLGTGGWWPRREGLWWGGPEEDLVAVSVAAADDDDHDDGAGGQMQDGLAAELESGPDRGDVVDGGGEEGKRVMGGFGQLVVAAENVDKLVDV